MTTPRALSHPRSHPLSAAPVTRGLVIRLPWTEHIFAGRKDWEIRGRPTTIRGPIGIIEKGTGLVMGCATIVDCHGPLSRPERVAAAKAGHILAEEIDEDLYADVYGWVLADVVRFETPVPYRHRSGAVQFTTLDPDVTAAIERHRGRPRQAARPPAPSSRARR